MKYFVFLGVLCLGFAGYCESEIELKVAKSVVQISDEEGAVAGVVVDESGVVMTPLYGVLTPLKQQVQAFVKRGTRSELRTFDGVTFLGAHPKRDVAWVRINAPKGTRFEAVALAKRGPKSGEKVIIGGLGDGFLVPAILTPNVKSVKMNQLEMEISGRSFISLSGFAGVGMDGGPVCNANGELVGLVSLRPEQFEDRSQSFAIPTWWFGPDDVKPLEKRVVDVELGTDFNRLGNRFLSMADWEKGDMKRLLLELAFVCHRAAICALPLDPAPYHNVGISHYALGRKSVAIAYFRRALALSPDGHKQHFLHGAIAYETGDVARARRHWKEGAEHGAPLVGAQCAAALAEEYAKENKMAAAAFLMRWSLNVYDLGVGPYSDMRRKSFRKYSEHLSDNQYAILSRLQEHGSWKTFSAFVGGTLKYEALPKVPSKVRAVDWKKLAAQAKASPALPPRTGKSLAVDGDFGWPIVVGGRYLLSGRRGDQPELVDLISDKRVKIPEAFDRMRFCPAGADMLVLQKSGTEVAVYAPETGALRHTLAIQGDRRVTAIRGSAYRTDYALVLVAGARMAHQQEIMMLNLGTGKLMNFGNFSTVGSKLFMGTRGAFEVDERLNYVYSTSMQATLSMIDWKRLDLHIVLPTAKDVPPRLKKEFARIPPVVSGRKIVNGSGDVLREFTRNQRVSSIAGTSDYLVWDSDTRATIRDLRSWKSRGVLSSEKRATTIYASATLGRVLISGWGTRLLPLPAGGATAEPIRPAPTTGKINPKPLTRDEIVARKKPLAPGGVERSWPHKTVRLRPFYGSAFAAVEYEALSKVDLIDLVSGRIAGQIPNVGPDDVIASAQRILVVLKPVEEKLEVWDLDHVKLARVVPLKVPKGYYIESFGMGRDVANMGIATLRKKKEATRPPVVVRLNPITGKMTQVRVKGRSWDNPGYHITTFEKTLLCDPRLTRIFPIMVQLGGVQDVMQHSKSGISVSALEDGGVSYVHAVSSDGRLIFGGRELIDATTGKELRLSIPSGGRSFPIFGSPYFVNGKARSNNGSSQSKLTVFDPKSGKEVNHYWFPNSSDFQVTADDVKDFLMVGSGLLDRVLVICNNSQKLYLRTLSKSAQAASGPAPLEGLPVDPVTVYQKTHWSLHPRLPSGTVIKILEQPPGFNAHRSDGGRRYYMEWPPNSARKAGDYKLVLEYGPRSGEKRKATIRFNVSNK